MEFSQLTGVTILHGHKSMAAGDNPPFLLGLDPRLCYLSRAVTKSTIRLCIVEKHSLVRAGVKMLLHANPDFDVVGEATNREEALKIGAQKRPHLFLVVVGPGPDVAPDLLRELLASSPGARAILVTSSKDSELLH